MRNWSPGRPLRWLMVGYAAVMTTLLLLAFALGEERAAMLCLVGAAPGIAACVYVARGRRRSHS